MQIFGGNSRKVADVDGAFSGVIVSKRPNGSNGSYRLAAKTGLLIGVAAASASAGHIFALRNAASSPSVYMLIRYLRLRWQTVTAFTTEQQIGLKAFLTRAYSASHGGGTALDKTAAGGFRKLASMPQSSLTDARIATTGALTNGTHTIDAQEFLELIGFSQTGAAPAVTTQPFADYDARNADVHPIVLSQNEGLIIANSVAMGAAGTAVVSVEMDWDEVTSYPY